MAQAEFGCYLARFGNILRNNCFYKRSNFGNTLKILASLLLGEIFYIVLL
jgi:hypothetical protein